MDYQVKQEVERKRYREFTVTPGFCGFKVRIGRSEAYFGSVDNLVTAIENYLQNPQATERKFQNADIRIGGTLEPPAYEAQEVSTHEPGRVNTVQQAPRKMHLQKPEITSL